MRHLLFVFLGLAACGGNVVVDHGNGTGSGGSGNAGAGGSGASGAGGPSTTGVGGGDPACDAPAVAPSDGVCFANLGTCNPVTGAPCSIQQGQSCDIGPNSFACFDEQDPIALCGTCNNDGGPFCGPTMTCLSDHKCARYCCNDGDCGTGFCDKADPALAGSGAGVCKARSH